MANPGVVTVTNRPPLDLSHPRDVDPGGAPPPAPPPRTLPPRTVDPEPIPPAAPAPTLSTR
ncbi:MAG TPA: hypothetical protein VLK36_14285 [Gaiellaceae bacterium]|nr:hypothetical protein [Gaiellaceae bacterium]